MWRRKVWAVGIVFALCFFGMTPSVAADELAEQTDEATEAPDGEDEEDASASEGPEGEQRLEINTIPISIWGRTSVES